VRFLNREPISLDITYVPLSIGNRLAKEDLAARDVFVILENDYGLALGHAELQIGSNARRRHARCAAEGRRSSPVLFIEPPRTPPTAHPSTTSTSITRGDAFQYKVRVDRVPLSDRAS